MGDARSTSPPCKVSSRNDGPSSPETVVGWGCNDLVTLLAVKSHICWAIGGAEFIFTVDQQLAEFSAVLEANVKGSVGNLFA